MGGLIIKRDDVFFEILTNLILLNYKKNFSIATIINNQCWERRKEIPIKYIELLAQHSFWSFRLLAARCVCDRSDMSPETVGRLLNDEYLYVRQAMVDACEKGSRYPIGRVGTVFDRPVCVGFDQAIKNTRFGQITVAQTPSADDDVSAPDSKVFFEIFMS